MSVTTVVLIVGTGLLLYYCGLVAYDLYLDSLAQSNKDEDKEKAIDISGQASEFQSIPVNNPKVQHSVFKKFQNVIATGISASKANSLMLSAAEGETLSELEALEYAILSYDIQE